MTKIFTEKIDGSTFIRAQGPSQHDIRRQIHERLVGGLNRKVDLAMARELVRLGWTPPAGHPVLDEPSERSSKP